MVRVEYSIQDLLINIQFAKQQTYKWISIQIQIIHIFGINFTGQYS